VLVSFVYVLGCRVLEFVVLFIRGERSKRNGQLCSPM